MTLGKGSLALASSLLLGLTACGGSVDNGGKSGGTGGSGGSAGGNGGSAGGNGGSTSGCSLAVVATGPLKDPIAPTARVTGPSIVATDDGFVIGYREQDGATFDGLVVFLSDAGKLADAMLWDLGGCAEQQPIDGVSVAYEAGMGMFAASLPDCGKGAGAVFIPFGSKGNQGELAAGPRNGAFSDLTLGRVSALAPATNPGEYDFVYRLTTSDTSMVERVVLQGPAFKTSVPVLHPFGQGDLPFGLVASTPEVRAFLAADPAQNSVVGQVGTRVSDAIDVKGQFTLPLADWAAITAWDNRVAAAVPAGLGLNLVMAVLDANAVTVPATGLVGSHQATSGALARLRSHLFVAEGYAGGIAVHRLESADAALGLGPADSVELSASSAKVPLAGFDGTHLAMAAARQHVAVVWTTKAVLTSGDPTGGWALLDCAE